MPLALNTPPIGRRSFLRNSLATGVAALACPAIGASTASILGHGSFRYRVVPDWGTLGAETPLKNCHGIVCDGAGHVILLTDHTANNVIIYDKRGKLVHKWGHAFPGAHGLSLVQETGRVVIYITDLQTHRLLKTTLDGEILEEWRWPEATGKYAKESDYRPSWTLHSADGGFFVLDGYGRDYITHYGADGKLAGIFGGAEGGIPHWGPHGGLMDGPEGKEASLLVAMSDQQGLLRLSQKGAILEKLEMPGGNPRQIRLNQGHYFVAHLADNWPTDRNSRGFVSVLDAEFRAISNIGGSEPIYDGAHKLQAMTHAGETFVHPHDLCVDSEGSLYVAQFASGGTPPVKLERL